MSTYNLFENNYLDIKDNIEELIMCLAEKDLLSRRFGFSNNTKGSDLKLIMFLHDFFQERFCGTEEVDECFLSKINSLYYKYK